MINSKNKNTTLYSIASESKAFIKTQVSAFAEVWESKETGAKSLHSITQFFPGDIITQIGIKEYVETPNYLSVQIDEKQHIMLAPEFLQYINHSCDPNVSFDTINMVVICLKKIVIGEAMSFFYPSTEWSMTQSFDCLCGSNKCLNKVQGAAYLSPDVLSKYKLSEHIQTKLNSGEASAIY